MSQRDRVIVLFDVDGTLTPARNKITPNILEMLHRLKERVNVVVVSGSDFVKQKEQLGELVLDMVDYSFSENGLVAYHGHELIHSKSIRDYLGEDKLKRFLNFCLIYLGNLDIPIKRGTFIEFRTGLINISPIGRNCSQQERIDFEIYDNEHKVRAKMVSVLQEEFRDYNLKFSIGGQISFDVFPIGWDKTYCLSHISNFEEIHFFGDKTMEGGNDYEIYSAENVIGHTVKNPDDTFEIVSQIWLQ